MKRTLHVVGIVLCLLLVSGCGDHMRDQPKYEPLEYSAFFDDGKAAREIVPNTVARGRLWTDTHLYAGTVDGAPAETFPFPVTMPVLERGQERYAIYCTPCHGYDGYGDGIVVQSGLSPPPSFHTERLRNVPPGYMYDVITNGFGAMYGYAARIRPDDRWAIVAYVQALQLSQNAALTDAPPDVQAELDAQ